MYNVSLNIYFIGILQEQISAWMQIAPRPRFTHIFHTINSFDELPKNTPDCHQNLIIIAKDKLPNSLQADFLDSKNTIVIYADDCLSQEQIKFADEVWIRQSADMDKFYFEKSLDLIAERKEAWQQSAWLQATINSLPDMVWFKDYYGLHIEVNDAFCQIVDKPKDDVRGKDHYYIWNIPKEVYEQTDYVCVQTEDDVIAARKTVLFDEEVMKADGNLSKLKTYKTPIFDGETIIGTVGIARDVTKEYEYLQSIENLAHYDQLTGLANRNQLDLFLQQTHTTYMNIAYMDLDYFKHINDTFGHLVGDKALVLISDFIKKIFPDALNVRIGGDEFISIFTDKIDLEDIISRIQKLMDEFVAACKLDKAFEKLSISCGIAEGKIGHGSFDVLLNRADFALYKAKKAGKGRYFVSTRDDFSAE